MPVLPMLRRRGERRPSRRSVPARATLTGATPVAPATRQLPRAVVVLFGLTLAFGVLLGLNQLKDYVGPIFLALNLVLAAAPLQLGLIRRGLPGWAAALVSGAAVFTFLIAFFYALGWSIAAMVEELSGATYRTRYNELYGQLQDLLTRFGIEQDQALQQVRNAFNPEAIIGALGGVLGNVTGVLGLLMTTIIVIFFLLIDSMTAGRRIGLVREQHPRLAAALTSFGQGVRRYWVVATIFGLIVAVLDVVALLFLGVPLALAWGVLAFITNYIPNIGFVIGLVPPAIMALLANGPTNALLVVVVYSVLNFVVQSLIQPKFTGDAVGVTPTVTFVSLIVWAWVLGPIGALLAVPATLLVKALLVDSDPQARWANAFVASNPDTARADSTHEAVHQEV